jgi:two-component system phosphate regulon sensor histidine kinase PhoR
MLPRKLAGQLIAGQLLVAGAATAAMVAVHGGLNTTVVLLGLGLAALAVLTTLVASRTLARPLLGLSLAVERLADTITPRRTWTREMTDLTDLTGLIAELTRMTPRLRDRLDELTEERDRAGQILDALEDGVLLLDGAGRLLLANPAARAWFGLGDDLRSGLPARRVLGVPQIADLAAEAAVKRAPVVGIVTVVFPEDRTLSVRAFPLADRGLTGRIVVTMADISQRRRLEVLRRDFVANASHELKTPVAAVKALSEALQTALPDDPAASRRLAGRISRETERLDALVRDLLDLSRVERGTLAVEPVDLAGLTKEVVGSYADRAEDRHIELRSELQAHTTVRGDRAQLALLISNLVDNALRYTQSRGKVCVRLETLETRAVLQVADDGRGIPSNELTRIFERFYRVDKARARQTGGTGLGLAIVRHVVEGHGGSVDVESELGRGSTFTVNLPVAGPPVLPHPPG